MNKGFSVVEAIVVLTVVGLLVTLGYSRYKHHIAKSRQAEAKNNLRLIVALQEAVLLEHGKYSFLEKVGLDNSGPNKHSCRTNQPNKELLNELGFRPKNCEELRYQYRSPIHVRPKVTASPPEYIVRADSRPAITGVYIWPDCEDWDMWRLARNSSSSRFQIRQAYDGEFAQLRRILETCK